MATPSTRESLLEQGALLYARHGVSGVSIKTLHEAVGARNESALHYHFGSQSGLLEAILRVHLEAVERRRVELAEEIRSQGTTGDLRAIVNGLARPMAEDLHDPVGRAHLRIVAQLSHPTLAFDTAFRSAREVDVDVTSGTQMVRWLQAALPHLSAPVNMERLADLRGHLLSAFGHRAQLIDDNHRRGSTNDVELFVENLLDMLVAGLTVTPSPATLAAAGKQPKSRRSRRL